MEPDDPSDDAGQVRLTLRLPRDLYEQLVVSSKEKPGSSLNSEIIDHLNSGLLDEESPEAVIRQIRNLVRILSLYTRKNKDELTSAAKKADYYIEMANKAWDKIVAEGRDPYEFFEVKRPSEQPKSTLAAATAEPEPKPQPDKTEPVAPAPRKMLFIRKRPITAKPKPE